MDWKPEKRQVDIMCHALGIPSAGGSYRNHYVVGGPTDDWDAPDWCLCMELVEHEFMIVEHDRELLNGMDIFYVTNQGKDYLGV